MIRKTLWLSPVVHEAGLLVLALEEEELYLMSEAVDLGHQPRLGAVSHLPAPSTLLALVSLTLATVISTS